MHDLIQKKYTRQLLNVKIAFEALMSNKVRSLLSALGIIFGVAAVISMLAIGKGTEQEIMEKMEEVGVNNIIIKTFAQTDAKQDSKEQKTAGKDDSEMPMPGRRNRTKKYSPGLSLKDLEAIRTVLSNIEAASPYAEQVLFASHEGRYANVSVKGTSGEYFGMYRLEAEQGACFSAAHNENSLPVCVLSRNAKQKLFGANNAIKKKIKIGKLWFTVIGVLKQINSSSKASVSDLSIYIPFRSYCMRFDKKQAHTEGRPAAMPQTGMQSNKPERIIVQVQNTNQLQASSETIERLLKRRHLGVKDYEVEIPELLLKQQEETKSIFNIVLGIIAGISLLVGGIGIMNIMNASVLERTREIGVRMATGANKNDISSQFLAEAILICLSGGVIGVAAGTVMALLIKHSTGIETIITIGSIATAFGVTTAVGIFFGYYPAKKASVKDPIESLRYE